MDTNNQAVKPEVNESAKEKRVKAVVIDSILEIEKAEDKKLVVRIMEFKGHRYLDMRMAGMEEGEWRFAGGVTLNKKSFTHFLDVLNSREEDIELALNAQTPDV